MSAPTKIRSATFKLADAILFDRVQQPRESPENHFDVPPIPSMICAHERRFMHYLTRHHYTGSGTVVDMGPLFGSSTYALLSGMSNGCVHSYDLWHFYPDWENLLGRALPPGADVYPVFAANLSSLIHRVKPHKGDLLQQRWDGGPIEILFVDAAKSKELMLHIANEFFPRSCLAPTSCNRIGSASALRGFRSPWACSRSISRSWTVPKVERSVFA